MSKRSQHCGLLVFCFLLCQVALYGLVLTGWWPYILALVLGGLALSGCLKLFCEQRPPEIRVENHYHLYYQDGPTPRSRFTDNYPPSRW